MWQVLVQRSQFLHADFDAWHTENGAQPWFNLQTYTGVQWDDPDRIVDGVKDGWPDYEYDQYQQLRSQVEATHAQIADKQPQVKGVVTTFWALTQVVTRAWHIFASVLPESDDPRNHRLSEKTAAVCALMEATTLVPNDFFPWKEFIEELVRRLHGNAH